MADDDRTRLLGLWRYASEYLKAARTLDDVDPNPWVASSVAYQCACQGLELAFKAYLRASGMSVDQLRAIGHSQVRGMKEAHDLGLTGLNDEDRGSIPLIDTYYSQYEFRYIVTGAKEYPPLGALLGAGARILAASAVLVARDMGNESFARRTTLDVSATFGVPPSL